MSALQVVEPVGGPVAGPSDPLARRLSGIADELAALVTDALAGVVDDATEAATEADLIDQIAACERLRAAVAAAQASRTVALGLARTERETAEGRHPRDVGRGLVEEIGLACGLAPWLAARRFSTARAWWFDLPHTCTALAAGEISEQVAGVVASETSHLDATTRRGVDARLAGRLGGLARKQAEALVRRHAYEADRHAYVGRAGPPGRTAASPCARHRTRWRS